MFRVSSSVRVSGNFDISKDILANCVTANQSIFESVIAAIEHFARDSSDLTTARTAFGLLTKMTSLWGGPDIPLPPSTTAAELATSPVVITTNPVLPGFDQFAITRFSPLSWAIPATPGFRVQDPSSRGLVADIASLQQEILRKTGGMYLRALEMELRGMGAADADILTYLDKLRGDIKGFRDFLVGFLGRGS